MELRQVVKFSAAFDRRHAEPSKNYGVGGVTVMFAVVGDHGAVEWDLLTGWHLTEVVGWWTSAGLLGPHTYKATAGPVNYHERRPSDRTPRGETPAKDCTLLEGDCYNGGVAFCDGDLIFERLIREGDAGLWAALEERYTAHFVLPHPEIPL